MTTLQMNETISPLATECSSAGLSSSTTPEGTHEENEDSIVEILSFQHKLFVMYTDFCVFYCALPMWIRIIGTIMALVIIIDGAILFFTLIGAFGYLSDQTQASILEWSIQIINVCFTSICLIELPFRLKDIKTWLMLSMSGNTNTGSCSSIDNNSTGSDSYSEGLFASQGERWNDLIKAYKKPTNDNYKWKLFGCLNILKLLQIMCQCWVEYLCVAYIGRQQQRPALWFGVAVGFALPVGCGLGCVEGYLKS